MIRLHEIAGLPTWLVNENDKKTLFYQYLNNNQFKEAWFTLNSKGWDLNDVATALINLKDKSGDDELALVTDNWIERWRKSL